LEKDLFVGGRNKVHTLPVLSFVIEHPRGLFVFDTGLNPSLVPHSRRFVGRPSERVIRFQSASEMTLSVQMQERGLSPEDVTHVALSHLHCDHTGNLRAFPQAQVLLTHQEWQAAQSPHRRLRGNLDPRYSGLSPTLIDLPVDDSSTPCKIPKGSYSLDCMGDGSLVLVPTFGHTWAPIVVGLSPAWGRAAGRRRRVCAGGLHQTSGATPCPMSRRRLAQPART